MNKNRIPTKIHPDLLNTIGRSFRFNHGKGLAEWLKNSLDNYLRLVESNHEPIQGRWPIFINLIDAKSQASGPNLAVIDFGGTDHSNIDKFFLHWGDTHAASLGGKIKPSGLTGGHGNGGKFYMREMWKDGARFLTWKDGMATSLVVEKSDDGTTGYWEFQNEKMSWRDALNNALPKAESLQSSEWLSEGLSQLFPNVLEELDTGSRGLSVIVGRRAVQIHSNNDVVFGGKWKHQKLIDDLLDAQQAKRPIRELNISVFKNGSLILNPVELEKIPLDETWAKLAADMEPAYLKDYIKGDVEGSPVKLVIDKSTQSLTGRYKHHNILSVLDTNNNPMAFYQVKELPLPGHSPILEFLFGELVLSFPGSKDLVQNDREKLIDSPLTQAILGWVADELWSRVKQFEESQRDKTRKKELNIAEVLNDALNDHAKRFLEELETEINVDYVKDEAGGGVGTEGEGTTGTGNGSGEVGHTKGTGGSKGKGGTKEVEGVRKKKKRPRFPQVLLSGHSPDPAREDGDTKYLSDRHPPVNQDDVDRLFNVWWLNTSHPYAKEALASGGASGPSFKNYHLFLFMQVVQMESLRILQRRQAELGLDVLENQILDISNKFLSGLPYDVVQNLLGAT